ncbi:MAG: hypothetical protein K0R09_1905 [Clostridiales bacterium]|jgi:uncharacterized protein (DUF2225 family)|nr:hypothetical protein [Clostridiales bacterium]
MIKMDKIFSGLEEFGFKNLNDVELYKQDNETPAETNSKGVDILDYLYDKSFTCPVCNCDVKVRSVKSGKTRLMSKDTDLMPRHEPINPMFYDVAICPKCGYAAMVKYFDKIKHEQTLIIKSTITPKFKAKAYPDIYDVDIAIERFKLALLNSVVKNSKMSERAYTCLKLAWMYRLKEDSETELKLLEQALIGFKDAFTKESFPICGMDTYTLIYLLGEISRRLGYPEDALRWFGKVIVTPGVNPRLKEMARDQKDLIK